MATATKAKRKPAPAAASAPAAEKKAAAKSATPKPARKASTKTTAKAKAQPQPKQTAPKPKTTPRAPKAKAQPKAPGITPYCSFGLIKGALVSETLQVFEEWDLEASKRANLDRVRASNSIGAPTQAWLKQVCTTFSRRFEPSGPDRSLALAARTATGRQHWRPLLLWHMANSEGLLGDGLAWTWEIFSAGGDLLQTDQALAWLESTGSQGHPEVAEWGESTRKRVAGGLLKAGVDFGLLQGRVKRRFTAYYLADEPLLYVLLQALASNRTTAAALSDPRWLWFRLPEAELEHRLLLLHQAQVISYYRAGSVVDLKLPASSAEALVQEVWT
ncbi:BrxA family protein [Synechococcus sp. CBW1004]|uniref:BrxA family protein n=1 Tax=Synechococcus sp. CBW1004 TaxID=1353136 RepID=UPI0018CDCE0D|nr:BrxA family protein [Synechococcus sp. CBW1004]QPN63672.1 DUF1819 family protein [Synechococcus sp. CBW1004]